METMVNHIFNPAMRGRECWNRQFYISAFIPCWQAILITINGGHQKPDFGLDLRLQGHHQAG
jgi:hypothetical protein